MLSPGVEAEVQNLDLAFAVGEATWDIARIPTVLRRVPRRHIVRALRIRDGERFRSAVLNPRTGPKTWAFFWNIHAPTLRERVTVDGRHADVIVNEMRGWQLKRGIDVGGPGSRYESYEHVTEDAASWLRRNGLPWMTAVQVQAIAWCHAKAIEQAGLTTRATPARTDQQGKDSGMCRDEEPTEAEHDDEIGEQLAEIDGRRCSPDTRTRRPGCVSATTSTEGREPYERR